MTCCRSLLKFLPSPLDIIHLHFTASISGIGLFILTYATGTLSPRMTLGIITLTPTRFHSLHAAAIIAAASTAGQFDQRYLLNDTFWGGPSFPILFYTGAEGTGVEAIWDHSCWILELARELRAVLVFAEHRFYGSSFPYGPVDSFLTQPDRVGMLSVEQAMGDYRVLITEIRARYGGPSTPVAVLGGSYAGSLAAWMRIRYPAAVDAALAASAPILGYPGLACHNETTFPFAWYRRVTETTARADPACPARIRAGFLALQSAWHDFPAITQAFNTCTPVITDGTAWDISFAAQSLMATGAESAYVTAAGRI